MPTHTKQHGLFWFFGLTFHGFWELVCLNFLFLVSCAPLFTIGPALSALAGTLASLTRDVAVSPIRDYFSTFRRHFARNFVLGLLLLCLFGILFLGTYTYWKLADNAPALYGLVALSISAILLLGCVAIHLWPLASASASPVSALLQQAIRHATASLPHTLAMLLLSALLLVLQLALFPLVLPVTLFFGLSLPGLLCTLAYTRQERMEPVQTD